MTPASVVAPDKVPSPFASPVYRLLFVATAVSNLGTWMQEVGRAWLMTELTASAPLIALLQSAAMTAMVLVVLPAGILADLVDRKRLILAGYLWLIAVASLLAWLAQTGAATPALILALSFAGAAGGAFISPASQAVLVPSIVVAMSKPTGPSSVAPSLPMAARVPSFGAVCWIRPEMVASMLNIAVFSGLP
jgi:MFS family permease